MIKTFEQFKKNILCESKYSVDFSEYTSGDTIHYLELACNLAYDCVMYCLENIKKVGGVIEFDPYPLHNNNGKTIYTTALKVKTQSIRDSECELYFNEDGEYLAFVIGNKEEIPVENATLSLFSMFELSDIVNDELGL